MNFLCRSCCCYTLVGVKINKAAERKELMWRRRLHNKIKELRKDLSQLELSKDKEVSNLRHW